MTNTGTPGGDATAADSTPASGSGPRLAIPSNLWDTGLLKPAWSRASEIGEQAAGGSLLHRPEGLTPTAAHGTDDEADGSAASEAEGGSADQEGTAPLFDPTPEPTQKPGIDPDLVVPAAVAAWAMGQRSQGGPALSAEPAEAEPSEPAETEPTATVAPETDEVHPPEPEGEETAPDEVDTETELEAVPEADPEPEPEPEPVPQSAPTRVVPFPPLTAPTAALTATPSPDLTPTPATSPAETAPVAVIGESGKGRTALVVGLVVVVVAALIGGGWFWWQGSQDGPIRDSFETSHGSFVIAATKLASAESTDDLAAAADDFAAATDQLAETRDLTEGRTSSLATSVRRAVTAELDVSQAAQGLVALEEGDFAAWGAARSDLRAGLQDLAGLHEDIEAGGGTTDDLPGVDLVGATDEIIGEAALRSGRQRTQRLTDDLAAAELLKDLRSVGKRAGTGADQLSGAVDGLSGSEIDTEVIAAHQGVQEALAKLTRMKPAQLNQWEPIRTQVARKADDLPDEAAAALTAALDDVDTLVADAVEAWEAWESQTEGARTDQQEDLEAVRSAGDDLDALLSELGGLDDALADFLRTGDSLTADGPTGEAATVLTEAADARDALGTEVLGWGLPDEVVAELTALDEALDAHALAVRSTADEAAACVLLCDLTQGAAWQGLVAERESQVAEIEETAQALRRAAKAAVKEVRQRELPEKPQI